MTLIVNLFGGPSTGKSTNAAGIFYKLKTQGINCEYIQEYAKDKTWQGDTFSLAVQPYITSKQLYRQHRVMGKVDVIVTDSPIILGVVYGGLYAGDKFNAWLIDAFKQLNNMNVFLTRNLDNHPYNPSGRTQTVDQAIDIDQLVREMLVKNNINFTEILVDHNTADNIVGLIKDRLE
jgi:nicotinamide riboside kinase